jgi:hypothetical protein
MLPNQLAGIKKSMGVTADTITFVTPEDCGHPLFADASVSNYYDPASRKYRASYPAFFHGCAGFNKSLSCCNH